MPVCAVVYHDALEHFSDAAELVDAVVVEVVCVKVGFDSDICITQHHGSGRTVWSGKEVVSDARNRQRAGTCRLVIREARRGRHETHGPAERIDALARHSRDDMSFEYQLWLPRLVMREIQLLKSGAKRGFVECWH